MDAVIAKMEGLEQTWAAAVRTLAKQSSKPDA